MDGSRTLRLINCVYTRLYLLLGYSRAVVNTTVHVVFMSIRRILWQSLVSLIPGKCRFGVALLRIAYPEAVSWGTVAGSSKQLHQPPGSHGPRFANIGAMVKFSSHQKRELGSLWLMMVVHLECQKVDVDIL